MNRWRFASIRVAAFCLAAPLIVAQVNVLTANYDNLRTNANLSEAVLNPQNVNSTNFGKLGTFPVDGSIYAQPLYVSGLQVAGQGVRNVVFVATMHNSVYAIDADAPQSRTPLWQVNLGPAVPSSVLGFTDILPEVGILSTPVIDLARGVIYVVTDTLEDGAPVYRVHALSLSNGSESLYGPVAIGATVAGRGPDASEDGLLSFNAGRHLQRPGLALANGAVYIAFGSHADIGQYHGWLFAYDASDLRNRISVLNTTPDGLGGSIWQAGRAPAIDEAGNIYVVSSNGDYDGASNLSESVLRLSDRRPPVSGDLATLSVQDWFTPGEWSMFNDRDWDLGSAGAILIPQTKLVVTGSKSGFLHLLQRDSMGRLDPDPSIVQSVQVNKWGVFSMALWPKNGGAIVYEHEPWGGLKAFQIENGQINSAILSNSPALRSLFVGMAVSANGSSDGSGIVWETTGDFDTRGTPGTLRAYDASDLSTELWNSNMVPERDELGRFAKFVAPTIANGHVYVPTFSNVLVTYGFLNGQTQDNGPVQITSVLNGASFMGGAVAPGEVVTIFGSNLGPTQAANLEVDTNGYTSASLSDTQVFFGEVAAPIVFTSSTQVMAIAPFSISGSTQIRVVHSNQSSDSVTLPVVPAAPALFSLDGNGGGFGAYLENGNPNSWAPAAGGSIVTFYATGAGQTIPASEDGKITSSLPPYALPLLPVLVFIDNLPADVLYAGAAPGLPAGYIQINVRVPEAVTQAAIVPVLLKVGDYSSPATVTLLTQ